jgi:hypothetical protein
MFAYYQDRFAYYLRQLDMPNNLSARAVHSLRNLYAKHTVVLDTPCTQLLSACTVLIADACCTGLYCTALLLYNNRWHIMSQWPVLEDTPSWCGDAVQCAALYGLGLLHQGTSDRLVTEMLLGEIAIVSSLDKVLLTANATSIVNVTANTASTTVTVIPQVLIQ